MRRVAVIIGFAVLLLYGCNGKGPQRPSQRIGEAPQVDSSQLALLKLNQQLANAADDQLAQIAHQQAESYALYDANAWVHIIDRGDEDSAAPQPGEEWMIRMRVLDLNEHLLMDSEQTYLLGKHKVPRAIDLNIGELHHGGKARMFVPWYSAFGLQGTEEIPPYTNVIIEIELR